MANKYIIEGAAFNGDGTTPDVAASNGAPGAWNTIAYFEGATPTYGSIAAGDTVYIRSKTAAGADLVRTLIASVVFGSTLASASQPVTWVVDGGQVWSGVSGVLRYECPSTFVVTQRDNNRFVGEVVDSIQIIETNASANQKTTIAFNTSGYFKNWLVDFTRATAVASGGAKSSTGGFGYGANPVLENVHWMAAGNWFSSIFNSQRAVNAILINPDIELISGVETSSPVFASGAESGSLTIIGGRIRGDGATSGQRVFSMSGPYGKGIKTVNFQWPRLMGTMFATPTGTVMSATLEAFGADGGAGAVIGACWGEMTSRSDGNPPTLNAFLPDSAQTPWSWQINPYAASHRNPATLTVGKYYTQEPESKTVTLEVLLSNESVNADRSSLWMSVSYIDIADNVRSVTSKLEHPAAIDASTANWSATTWGAISFQKKKLMVTTPTAIKKDTIVSVTLTLAYLQTNSEDILFVCPDAQLS